MLDLPLDDAVLAEQGAVAARAELDGYRIATCSHRPIRRRWSTRAAPWCSRSIAGTASASP
ncbi:MAG: hypothetical protein GEU96_03390 [Propionibacteriales bacterium]|nr:hypothetical protein [Propionibacteriales bacterium]